MNYIVYGLGEPDTNKILYIGMTSNISKRIRYHMKDSKLKEDTKKNIWLRNLKSESKTPYIEILEIVTSKDLGIESEKRHILFYSENGFVLLNETPGGIGGDTYNGREVSPEANERRKESLDKYHKNKWPNDNEFVKQCRRCLIVKPRTEFPKHSQLKDGLRPTCKPCTQFQNNNPSNSRDSMHEQQEEGKVGSKQK